MHDPDLQPAVRDLIRRSLATIDHVEILLHLRSTENVWTTAASIAAELHRDAKSIARCSQELVAAALIESDGHSAYRYAPTSAATRAAVNGLAELYDRRPLILIRVLQSRPSSVLRFFVDSFRFRDQG